MIDDWVTGVGAAALIAAALCPFLPYACPAAAVTKALKTYLERKRQDEINAPRPNSPTEVRVEVQTEEAQGLRIQDEGEVMAVRFESSEGSYSEKSKESAGNQASNKFGSYPNKPTPRKEFSQSSNPVKDSGMKR